MRTRLACAPPRRLEELLAGVPLELASLRVSGLCRDSRDVQAGDLFFCLASEERLARRHAAEAKERGASLVVAGPGLDSEGPILVVSDARRALSLAVFGLRPAPRVVGITGTNGKTTTSLLVASLLEASGRRVAALGTIGTVLGGEILEDSPNTTPDALDLSARFETLAARGCRWVALEVSSQGIVQQRVAGLPFAAVAFLNLSPEHMESHGTMAAYREAKLGLFRCAGDEARHRGLDPPPAIVNLDDESAPSFIEAAPGPVLTFGRAARADVRAEDVVSDLDGSRFRLVTREGSWAAHLPLPGMPNVANALAAAALGLALELPMPAVLLGLSRPWKVPGRFERIASSRRRVIVDYAHSSDALETLLASCRGLLAPGEKLCVVFGCGGDRDAGKRALMGAAAGRLADRIVLTSDNPRSEDPLAILESIASGVRSAAGASFSVLPEREEAIRTAILDAAERDLVVIAGKGHETYQISASGRRHFDDREVAREVLRGLEGA